VSAVFQWSVLPVRVDNPHALCCWLVLCYHRHTDSLRQRQVVSGRFNGAGQLSSRVLVPDPQRAVRLFGGIILPARLYHPTPMQPWILLQYPLCANSVHPGKMVPGSVHVADPVPFSVLLPHPQPEDNL
jgi:hypothetical protein